MKMGEAIDETRSLYFSRILLASAIYFDELEAELLRGDFGRAPEVLRNLVVDN